MSARVRWGALALALGLYGGALLLPAAKIDITWGNPPAGWLGDTSGYDVLRMGLKIPEILAEDQLDAPFFSFMVGWCANPVIWLSIVAIAFNRPRFATWASAIAVFMTLVPLPFWRSSIAFQPGYWCWCLSAATGLICFRATRHPIPSDLRSDYGPLAADREA
jgi:hypothetical protein